MPEDREHIDVLIIKFLQQTLTDAEHDQLDEWIEASDENQVLFEKLTDQKWISSEVEKFYSYDEEKGWGKITHHLNPPLKGEDFEKSERLKVFNWKRIAVAASIVLAIGIGSYLLFFDTRPQKGESPLRQLADRDDKTNDVKAPEANRAMIRLADGRVIYLDSAGNGQLAVQGDVRLVKNDDGKIVYSRESGAGSRELVWNTLSNPRGSNVIDLALADGSHVWLNAGSSVTFPVAFVGNVRRVRITGEAYFEVTHRITTPVPTQGSGSSTSGGQMPFIVEKGDMQVQVLGTKFNVNAYDDESEIKVTLLEGSVRVGSQESGAGSKNSVVIKPGEQAQVTNSINVLKGVNVDEVMAWKNGKFSFNNTDLKAIMREVMRWYDVEVVYEGNVGNRYFTADISRGKSLASLLKIFELSNIRFKIEGKRLVVMP